MSDEPQTATSPDEQKANAARLRAEGRKADAEATLANAEARKHAAQAVKAELDAAKARDDDRARRATDEFHHVYRFDGDVGTASVKRCLEKLTEWRRIDPWCEIEVIFSSGGGSIFDGMELFDYIVANGSDEAPIVTGGAGMAASMAGILVQAGTTRYVTKECWFLIHRAAFMAAGKTFEIEDRVDLIKRIEDRIISIFLNRSKDKGTKELTARMVRRNWDRTDWWLSSDECLEYGLVDEIRG